MPFRDTKGQQGTGSLHLLTKDLAGIGGLSSARAPGAVSPRGWLPSQCHAGDVGGHFLGLWCGLLLRIVWGHGAFSYGLKPAYGDGCERGSGAQRAAGTRPLHAGRAWDSLGWILFRDGCSIHLRGVSPDLSPKLLALIQGHAAVSQHGGHDITQQMGLPPLVMPVRSAVTSVPGQSPWRALALGGWGMPRILPYPCLQGILRHARPSCLSFACENACRRLRKCCTASGGNLGERPNRKPAQKLPLSAAQSCSSTRVKPMRRGALKRAIGLSEGDRTGLRGIPQMPYH